MPSNHTANVAPSTILDRLDPKVSAVLATILRQANEHDQKVYFVGGTVRDLYLETPLRDIDLLVEGDAIAFAEHLATSANATLVKHRRFGTATLTTQDFTLDLASARTETYPRSGALPIITTGTLYQDLRRRDFTINATALVLRPDGFGEIIDPCGGLTDLERGNIRVIHPESFKDDPTRIFRAIRYEQRLGFKLTAETQHLLKQSLDKLSMVSGDRIRRELARIFEEDKPELVLQRAGALGVLAAIHPRLHWTTTMTSAFTHLRLKSLLSHPIMATVLVHQMEPSDRSQLFRTLNFLDSWKTSARATIQACKRASSMASSTQRISELDDVLRNYSHEILHACRALTLSPIIGNKLDAYLVARANLSPHLTGNDLIDLGIPEGQPVGKALLQLRRAILDGELRTRAEEVALAKVISSRPKSTTKRG